MLIAGARLAIFQFHDVGIFYVLIDVAEGQQEDVGITAIVVKFRNRTVELALARHRQSETMNVGFALLLVALGGEALQTIGYVGKVGLECAFVSQLALQLGLVVLLKGEVVLFVSIQQIGVHLVAHHLVGNHKAGIALVGAVYRYHAEIEEQTQEIIWVVDALGREILHQGSRGESPGHDILYDAGIVGKLLVMADEHANLVVVDADVGFHQFLRNIIIVADVIIYKVEHHHGVVHGCVVVLFF